MRVFTQRTPTGEWGSESVRGERYDTTTTTTTKRASLLILESASLLILESASFHYERLRRDDSHVRGRRSARGCVHQVAPVAAHIHGRQPGAVLVQICPGVRAGGRPDSMQQLLVSGVDVDVRQIPHPDNRRGRQKRREAENAGQHSACQNDPAHDHDGRTPDVQLVLPEAEKRGARTRHCMRALFSLWRAHCACYRRRPRWRPPTMPRRRRRQQ